MNIKDLVKNFFRLFNLDIVRYRGESTNKSTRTDALSFHETKTGNYYLPKDALGDLIARAIKDDLIYDAKIYEIAKKYVRQGTVALDVGSNFGQMAILMSNLVGEFGTVHAFDADEFVYGILEKNIAENSKNIVAHFGAVHSKGNETLYFPVQDFERFGTYGSYGIDYVGGKGRPVTTIAIDEIEFKLPVSFMKIDIQGGDLHALKGSRKTIDRFRMPIVFEYEYLFEDELNLCFQDYVDFVKSIDYRFSKVINGQNYLILPKEKK